MLMGMAKTSWLSAKPQGEPSPTTAATDGRLPAIYLGHGAPPLLEDADWMAELGGWAASMPTPKQILIVSAHWQTAPMAISATTTGAAGLRLLRLPRALLPDDL